MRRAPAKHPSDEDITVADDHDLDPARRAAIAAHLSGCEPCRRRLAESRQVGRLLRVHLRGSDRPSAAAWQKLDGRLTQAPTRPAIWPRFAAAAAFLLFAFAFTAFRGALQRQPTSPPAAAPNSAPERIEHPAPSLAADDPLPFVPVEPLRLPSDLSRRERATPAPGRIETLYRNDAGLAILLSQQPAAEAASQPTFAAGPTGESTITLRDTPVRMLHDPWPQTVAAIEWQRAGIRFDALVTDTPPGGLSLAAASSIVEALIDAQTASS